jgi:hypothetical protein
MRTRLPLVFPLILASAGCLSTPQGNNTTDPLIIPSGGCAQTRVLVARHHWSGSFDVGATALPAIGIDLGDTPAADSSLVSVAPCDGHAAPKTRTQAGATSYLIDAMWLAANVPAGCFRVTAQALSAGTPIGQGVLTVRRGDYTLTGTVQAQPAGQPAAPQPFATVTAVIDRQHFTTRADETGAYSFTHLPGGRLFLVKAEAKRLPGQPPQSGETAPHLTLDAQHASASVIVTLEDAASVVDVYEPDDTIAAAQARTALTSGTQRHNVIADDVDLIPLSLRPAQQYTLQVVPVRARGADLALSVVDATGKVLAHTNDTPGNFSPSPSLLFTGPASGAIFVRISRNDRETRDAPYDFTLTAFLH